MKLAYFVHDLTDPAVRRRVRMLQSGGAEPVVLGFRRAATAPEAIEGARVVDLGRTYDARLGHRAAATVWTALGAGRLKAAVQGAEIVLARTLEMLTIAQAARRLAAPAARLAYECLDIHRLMLDAGAKGRALRAAERALMRRCDLLIVSSPAFLREYFEPVQGAALPKTTLLVENKVVELGPAPPLDAPPPGPPWRIAWLGAIRCRRSLALLHGLAARRPDLIEVAIHGRPALTEFEDFERDVSDLPNLSFGGAYRAEDLPGLYGRAHFAWAIDFMEAGLNSSWLLPNRLYEASAYGAVPIALADVETGRRLTDWGLGLRLSTIDALEARLDALSAGEVQRMRQDLLSAPRRQFVSDRADWRELVETLAGRSGAEAVCELSDGEQPRRVA